MIGHVFYAGHRLLTDVPCKRMQSSQKPRECWLHPHQHQPTILRNHDLENDEFSLPWCLHPGRAMPSFSCQGQCSDQSPLCLVKQADSLAHSLNKKYVTCGFCAKHGASRPSGLGTTLFCQAGDFTRGRKRPHVSCNDLHHGSRGVAMSQPSSKHLGEDFLLTFFLPCPQSGSG